MFQSIIAIIPARGGSKGIPGKNLRMVGGRPLLAWSIGHARQTPQIGRVFVSTDSAEIAAVARYYGAEVIHRPPDISGDTASSEACLEHALRALGARREGQSVERQGLVGESDALSASRIDLVVFLQPTSPLREPDDIQNAIETLEREQADSLFSACRVEGFVWRVERNGQARSFSYDYRARPRRQDAPEDLIENGSIYIFKPWVLRKFNNRLGGKIAVYRMPAVNSFQIDEPEDLELVEALMESQGANREALSCKSLGLGAKGEELSAKREGAIAKPKVLSELGAWLLPVRLLVLDFDGVLTDNRVLVSEEGTESVCCSREDGLGLERLRSAGVEVVVLSKEQNPVVGARCRKLGIECIQGCDTKLSSLLALAASRDLRSGGISYVGNDVNDLECMRWVGLPIAVADAMPEVLLAAKWVTAKRGGQGAVREVCEALLGAKVKAPST